MTGDTRWQWTYTALILIGTFALAIAATYLIEHPAAKRRIMAWQPKQHSKKREPLITLEVIEPDAESEEPSMEDVQEILPQENTTKEQNEK